jgi:predicted transcriptional regulator
MTKLLEQAIAKARELPPEEQDLLAAVLLSMAEARTGRFPDLDEETRAAIREGLEQAKRGEFVPDEEIEALWQRHRR